MSSSFLSWKSIYNHHKSKIDPYLQKHGLTLSICDMDSFEKMNKFLTMQQTRIKKQESVSYQTVDVFGKSLYENACVVGAPEEVEQKNGSVLYSYLEALRQSFSSETNQFLVYLEDAQEVCKFMCIFSLKELNRGEYAFVLLDKPTKTQEEMYKYKNKNKTIFLEKLASKLPESKLILPYLVRASLVYYIFHLQETNKWSSNINFHVDLIRLQGKNDLFYDQWSPDSKNKEPKHIGTLIRLYRDVFGVYPVYRTFYKEGGKELKKDSVLPWNEKLKALGIKKLVLFCPRDEEGHYLLPPIPTPKKNTPLIEQSELDGCVFESTRAYEKKYERLQRWTDEEIVLGHVEPLSPHLFQSYLD